MNKQRGILLVALLLLSLLTVIGPVSAAEHHVYSGEDIQKAIDDADAGDIIYVHAGIYKEETIVIDMNISLIGDGESTTILDGQGSHRVMETSGLDNTALISGFTIQNGKASSGNGAGMLNKNSSPTVTNCTFKNNKTDDTKGDYTSIDDFSSLVSICGLSEISGSGGCGYMYGGSEDYCGAGMYNGCDHEDDISESHGGDMDMIQDRDNNSSPIVINCTFIGNSATNKGGAIFNAYGSATIVTDCIFEGNSADFGGAIHNGMESHLTITNCMFSGNSATTAGAGMLSGKDSHTTVTNCVFEYNVSDDRGGGMLNGYDSESNVSYCTFRNNSAYKGAGMLNGNGASSTVTNCVFEENTAESHGAGMLNCKDSFPSITNCTFSNNSAGNMGGAMINENESSAALIDSNRYGSDAKDGSGAGMFNGLRASPTVTNCTFSNNSATNYGGAMHSGRESAPTVTNCTFWENTAGNKGGAMHCGKESSPIVTNCTLSNNSATNYGGAISIKWSYATVTNCILWGNTANECDEIYIDDPENSPEGTPVYIDATMDVTYSDVQGGYPGVGNIDASPHFVNVGSGDLRLSGSSPCIDSGTDTSGAEYGAVTDDIIGTLRPQIDAYDMGAYEYVPESWSPLSLQPLVISKLAQANSLWTDILPLLGTCTDEDILSKANQVQEEIQKATAIANPVAACGGLSQAIGVMEDISEMIS